MNGRVTASGALDRLQKGPMTIGVAASNDVFRYYKSGILYSSNLCPTRLLDHSVLLVGYAVEPVNTVSMTTCRAALTKELNL